MNLEECKTFLGELIAAYPAIEFIAKQNSPDLAATHRGWAKAWTDLELSDCRLVLDQLQRGLLDQPTKEEKESPGVWIKRLVHRKNGIKSEAEIAAKRESFSTKRQKQKEYAEAGYSCSKALEAMKIGRAIDEAMKLV